MRVLIVFLALAIPLMSIAQTSAMKHGDGTEHKMINKPDLKWVDAPPALPTGAKTAILSGDPSQPGTFSLRVMMPANYRVPPHTHPTIENVVVLEGTLYMGSGEKLNESTATALETGGFSSIPANAPHYVFTKEPVVIQIYAEGPFAITYINPADDPRNGTGKK